MTTRVQCPRCEHKFEPKGFEFVRTDEDLENDRQSEEMFAQLSPRMRHVAALLMQCRSDTETAVILGTTRQTVKNYRRDIYDKWGVTGILDTALKIAEHPLLHRLIADSLKTAWTTVPHPNRKQAVTA